MLSISFDPTCLERLLLSYSWLCPFIKSYTSLTSSHSLQSVPVFHKSSSHLASFILYWCSLNTPLVFAQHLPNLGQIYVYPIQQTTPYTSELCQERVNQELKCSCWAVKCLAHIHFEVTLSKPVRIYRYGCWVSYTRDVHLRKISKGKEVNQDFQVYYLFNKETLVTK